MYVPEFMDPISHPVDLEGWMLFFLFFPCNKGTFGGALVHPLVLTPLHAHDSASHAQIQGPRTSIKYTRVTLKSESQCYIYSLSTCNFQDSLKHHAMSCMSVQVPGNQAIC